MTPQNPPPALPPPQPHKHWHHARPSARRLKHVRQSLFWRVYLHGIFMVLVVITTVAVLSLPFRNPTHWREIPVRMGQYLERQLQKGDRGPELFQEELDRVAQVFPVRASIYRLDGQLLATTSTPPLPPDPELAQRFRGPEWQKTSQSGSYVDLPGPGWRFAVLLHKDNAAWGYVLVSGQAPLPAFWPGVGVVLMGVMVALGAASVPLVRAIVRPIERLIETTKAFGAGDLSVRSGIQRDDEAGQLAHAFDEMASHLETLVRNEKELMANVSHELRTPLARIQFALQLAEDDPEEMRRYLGEIRKDLAELNQLVEDVLITARLELAEGRMGGGVPPLRLSLLSAQELITSSSERFRSAWPDRELRVETIPSAPDVPSVEALQLKVDPVLMRRVLDNLLDNARKYGDANEPISLRSQVLPDHSLKLEVEDRGAGISDRDLPHLFTPFFRTDRSRDRETGGIGLGLTVVKRVVEAHGGTVQVRSAECSGTVFEIHLPRS